MSLHGFAGRSGYSANRFLSVAAFFVIFTLVSTHSSGFDLNEKSVAKLLPSDCLEFTPKGSIWRYRYCHLAHIEQFLTHAGGTDLESRHTLGKWVPSSGPTALHTVGDSIVLTYTGGDGCGKGGTQRMAMARLACSGSCGTKNAVAHVSGIQEPTTCAYVVDICVPALCSRLSTSKTTAQMQKKSSSTVGDRQARKKPMSRNDKDEILDKIKAIFYHSYDAYLKHAFPLDELRPLSCSGANTDLTPGGMLTLIDGLDTLATLGNVTEFRRIVNVIGKYEGKLFELDVKVSVFETTIRILGGLLSAHMIAVDPELPFFYREYDGVLLRMGKDLGDRLFPAFKSTTSVPYGTIHMKYGVPQGETTEACTAAAGSLSLEFGMLSVLTGDPKYGKAARSALKAIFDLRSSLNLVGRHLDINSGQWTEAVAGIGSNIDSVYEYYLKQYILFGDDESLEWFQILYEGAVRHLRLSEAGGRFYHEVDMKSGQVVRRYCSALQAFWPGVQILAGDVLAATKSLNGFLSVWEFTDLIPEDFDLVRWATVRGGGHSAYLLRPELAESVFYAYQATKDESWLQAGKDMLDSVSANCFVPKCGYAAISDVDTKQQLDMMPSFFLSEWVKYMFLLFDDSNFLNTGNWVFSTEAHPFRVTNTTQKNDFTFEKNQRPAFKSKAERKKRYSRQDIINDIPSLDDNDDICRDLRAFPPEVYYKTTDLISAQSLRPFDKEVPPEDNAAEKKISGFLEDVGMFEIVSTSSSFTITKTESDEKLLISNLDSTTAMVWTSDGRPPVFVTLKPHDSFHFGKTCQVEMSVSDMCGAHSLANVANWRKPEKTVVYRGSCGVSDGFGEPSWNFYDSKFDFPLRNFPAARHLCNAELTAMPDRNATHGIGPFFAIAARGECSFEEKAQSAFELGAMGLIVALSDAKDEPFIMAHAWNGFKDQYRPSTSAFLVKQELTEKLASIQRRLHANATVRINMRPDGRALTESGRVTVAAFGGWKAVFGPQDQGVYRLNLRKYP